MYLFILAYLILLLSLFTYDERFFIPSIDKVNINQIPPLGADKIASGTLDEARISSLNANKLSGTLDEARISSLDANKLSGTLDEARISSLNANKLSGSIPPTVDVDGSSIKGTLNPGVQIDYIANIINKPETVTIGEESITGNKIKATSIPWSKLDIQDT